MADNASAGATPVVAGATPTQTPPVQPAPAAPVEPATGYPDGLGDTGKRALDLMKSERDAAQRAAKAAEKALDDLKTAGASESEKALKAARAEGASEVTERVNGRLRKSEVKLALSAAGINPSVLDLAVNAAEFGSLKVGDDGEVEGLIPAVAAFKATRADLFSPARVVGSADGGAGTSATRASGKTFTREQLRDPKFWQDNKADILVAQREGRITG